MFFADLVNQGGVPALEKMLAFTEARHRVLTENIANADTPGYVSKDVDPQAFQSALRKAIDTAPANGGELRLPQSDQFKEDASGHLIVTPQSIADNVLFHDGTNMSIEHQMSMLAENGMMHQTMTELLRERFEQLTSAIRGTVR